MNFKIDVYSNNDSVDTPEELAKLLERTADEIRKRSRHLPRTAPQKVFTSVGGGLGICGTYKISPVDRAMGLDP
jgi:hypothetical protein